MEWVNLNQWIILNDIISLDSSNLHIIESNALNTDPITTTQVKESQIIGKTLKSNRNSSQVWLERLIHSNRIADLELIELIVR